MRILIADDDAVARRAVTMILRNSGHETVEVCNGDQAWELMQGRDAPHLAILDWMMPGMNGVDVCRKLRTLEREISPYIILLTGMNEKKDLLQGFDAGADDYVTKPFDPDEMNARVRAGERIVNLQIESLLARNALRKLVTHDYLTGLRNRAAILEELRRELDRSLRTKFPVNVVMVDIDHFKQINDNFGHPFGHKVLAEVANRMLSEVRSYEAVGRYGGEEFLIVLSGCDPLGANKQAERVRNRVGEKKISVQGVKVEITVSMGIASSCHVEQPAQELLIRMADAAVYRAKRAGRNRVELASGEQEQFSTPAEDPDAFDLSTDSSPRKGEGEWAEEETRAGLTQLSPPAELV